jgi:ABC-2 type transport system ATP-binding protein
MSGEIVIEAKGLTKKYGAATAVDHISFSVGRGEIFGLLGPNGAGKTTTILMMLGLTDISEGEIRVLGFDPAREPLSVKRRVGYLPDAVGFYDQLTAADNLRYTARLIGFKKAEREEKIAVQPFSRAGRKMPSLPQIIWYTRSR